jgi:hypothetical protein
MVENGRMEATLPMTDDSRRRQRIDAQMAYEEATEFLAGLILKLKAISRRANRIATVTGAVEIDSPEPLQSESPLLLLSPAEYEGIDFDTVRELANTIVLARKEVTQAKALARAMGCNV